MTDRNLLEDDIIDLTDLLEEGSPPLKAKQEVAKKKVAHEPDSFDLGKEISMDLDVSVEEIEPSGPGAAEEPPLDLEMPPRVQPAVEVGVEEPLGGLKAEIDMVMQERMEEVTLTKNEEDVLLRDEPAEEAPRVSAEEPAEIPAPEPAPHRETVGALPDMQQAAPYVPVPTEVIIDAVVDEFRRDMPALLEGIVRPVVQELLQEIIASTRDALPGIVEKVIREEIDKLRKL